MRNGLLIAIWAIFNLVTLYAFFVFASRAIKEMIAAAYWEPNFFRALFIIILLILVNPGIYKVFKKTAPNTSSSYNGTTPPQSS